MPLKAVIFDLDGTLADTIPLAVEAHRYLAESVLGRRPEPEEVTHFFGLCDIGIMSGLLGMSPDDEDLPREKLLSYYQQLHPTLSPSCFEGVVEMLRKLREMGLRIALVSGRGEASGRLSLEYFGILDFFEWMGFGSPYKNPKVDHLTRLLQEWDLSPQEAIYVGDAATDIRDSHALGMRIVNAAWSPTCHGSEAECLALKPDYRLDSLASFVPLIQSLMRS